MAVCIKSDRLHIDGLTTAPTDPNIEAGDIYYNTDDDVLYRYDQEGEWVPVGGGAIFVQETEPDVSRGVDVAGMLWLDTGVSAALRVWDGYSWIEIIDPEASNRAIARNTAPSNPVTGDSWLNTNDGILYVWNNSWVPVTKSIDSYDELADLTDVTNADTAPAGHILQANGDGTFTFVDSTPSLLDLTDITNAASSSAGQILQSNTNGTSFTFVTPITELNDLENVSGTTVTGRILTRSGTTNSIAQYNFVEHEHELDELLDVDATNVQSDPRPTGDTVTDYILTADGDGTYSFQAERSANAWYGPTPPNDPFTGELWYFNDDSGRAGLYVWNGDAWVETWGGFQEIDITPTVTINSSITSLPEDNSGNFTIDAQYDADSVIDLVILSGGGSLSTTTPAPGGSVTYTPANVSASTTVEIEATVINPLGETVTDSITFTVTDTPAPTVAISGSTADIAYGGNRTFTISSTNDVDGSIAVSITSGGGTLSTSTTTTSGSFVYTPGSYSGSATITATAVNYDNETATSTVTVNALANITPATGGSNVNGQTALLQIRTSDYISSGGTFEIPSNYWIWSDNTGVAALTVDTPNATVSNYGRIIGRGGNGGNSENAVGGAGGPAISVTASGVTIENHSGAYIAGGGGGGGAGRGDEWGGGGGGAGGGSGGRGSSNGGNGGSGGAGGAINASGGNGQLTMGVASWSTNAQGGGAGGGGGYGWGSDQAGSAGGGGRILPGSGGAGGRRGSDSRYGGAGGSGGNAGGGGHADPYHGHASAGGGGGGGWGANGGNGGAPHGMAHGSTTAGNGQSGGAGGAAVSGSYTRGTWSGTVYGSS